MPAFGRATPRLRFNAVEPGFIPGSSLGRDAGAVAVFVSRHVYYDERGKPMLGSAQVRDPEFDDRVVSETRSLLATLPSTPS